MAICTFTHTLVLGSGTCIHTLAICTCGFCKGPPRVPQGSRKGPPGVPSKGPPKGSPKGSPQGSPHGSPHRSPQGSPQGSPQRPPPGSQRVPPKGPSKVPLHKGPPPGPPKDTSNGPPRVPRRVPLRVLQGLPHVSRQVWKYACMCTPPIFTVGFMYTNLQNRICTYGVLHYDCVSSVVLCCAVLRHATPDRAMPRYIEI